MAGCVTARETKPSARRKKWVSSSILTFLIAAAPLGATLGLAVTVATDVKPGLTIFVLCPPAFVIWAVMSFLRIDDLPTWGIVTAAFLVVGANAALYGITMNIWNSLPQKLR